MDVANTMVGWMAGEYYDLRQSKRYMSVTRGKICSISPEPSTIVNSEDYNNPSEVRSPIIERLEDILATRGKTDVPAPFWAFCQLADVKHLEELAEQLQAYITPLEPGFSKGFASMSVHQVFVNTCVPLLYGATEESGQRRIVFFD